MQLPPTNSLSSDTPPQGGNRRTLMLLIGGGVLALILIAVGAVVLAGQLFTKRPNSIPQLLAGDTQIYAAITPNLSDLPNIERLRQAFPEAVDYQNDESVNKQLKESLGVTFNEDVAPWIGTEVAFAISGIPFDDMLNPEAAALGESPDITNSKVVFVLTSRDEKAAQAFLDKQRQFREGKGEQFTSSQAEGATIYARQGGDPSPIAAFGLVRGNVIFATNSDLITAIATRDANGKDTLAASTRYQQVLAALSADRLGFVFVNGEPMAQALQANRDQFVAELPEATANQLLEQLKSVDALQGVGFSFSVLADGVAFDAITVFDRAGLSQATLDQLKEAGNPVSTERVGSVSADALAAVSFRLPSTFGEQIRQNIESTPDAAEQVAMMEEQFNIDLDRDLFSWLEGEGTLVLMPGEEIAGSPLPVTGYIAIKPSDAAAAKDGMGRIMAAIDKASEGQLGLHEETIGGVAWQAFGVADEVAGGYGFVGDDLVIGIGLKTLETVASPAKPLSGEPVYQLGTKVLPAPSASLMFVNLPSIVSLMEEQAAFDDPTVTERLKPFKAITGGVTPGIDDKGVSSGRLFFVISGK
ncbi:MAG: DUF3352 domain-containing protein [Oscillochloris sp.]|nr:DUF3352 domain-containing protein [Oscillochloris sp.]